MEHLESASSSVRRDKEFFLFWRDNVNPQTQGLENRLVKFPIEITSIKQFNLIILLNMGNHCC